MAVLFSRKSLAVLQPFEIFLVSQHLSMGKYNVIFKCGHEEEVSLFGKYKDREKRIEWYQKECDCSKCRTAAYRKKMAETHFEVVMPYWYYKQNYPDCKTLRDSFNRETNEILVFVPKKNVKKGE